MERHTMHNFSLDKGNGATESKIITPAVLGIAHSHGKKLPSNMTPDEKQQLMAKLEEWRKARREKLAASILAKQKQAVKSQIPGPTSSKPKPVSSEVNEAKAQEKPSVFERLYKNNCSIKKVDVSHNYKKSAPAAKPAMRKMSFVTHEKPINQNKIMVNKKKIEFMHKTCEPQVTDEKDKPGSTEGTALISNKSDCQIESPTKPENSGSGNVDTLAHSDPVLPNEALETPETLFVEPPKQSEPGEITGTGTVDSECKLQSEKSVNVELKTGEKDLELEDQSLGVFEPIIEETNNVADGNEEEESENVKVKETIEKEKIENVKEKDKIENVKEKEKVENVKGKEKIENVKENSDSQKENKAKLKTQFGAFNSKMSVLPTKTWKSVHSKITKTGPVNKYEEKNVGKVDKEKGKEKNKFPTLRRSISLMFREKRKTDVGIRRSMSTKSLKEVDMGKNKIEGRFTMNLPRYSQNPKKEKEVVSNKSVSFLTPKTNKFPNSSYLRDKLEDWLKTNGHSLEGYRHLRCFGIHNKDTQGSDSSVIISDISDNSYYATAPNTPADESDKENMTPPTVLQQVHVEEASNWLKDLHRLIVEVKYPSERCEEWLTAIRKKCPTCTQLPIYWECLAALDESKGDLKSAIEGYERAIIKGGEVDSVGESLAQLFDKMVLEQKKGSKPKLEKGIDPKNIFKSTIIKFALQQKALKKLGPDLEPGVRQQLYVATPVRRSTRIHTPFKSRDVTSLQGLTPDVLKSVTFKPNQSLIAED